MTSTMGSPMPTASKPPQQRLARSYDSTTHLHTLHTQGSLARLRRFLQYVQEPLLWMVDALGVVLVMLAGFSVFCRHLYMVVRFLLEDYREASEYSRTPKVHG